MVTIPTVKWRLAFAGFAAGVLFAPQFASAQIIAYKVGEVNSGMTKQCIYNALGSQYTRTISSVSLCPLSIQVASTQSYNSPPPVAELNGGTAFKSGEVVTGMTKQCFYNYLGSQVARTISSVSLCPLTINVGD